MLFILPLFAFSKSDPKHGDNDCLQQEEKLYIQALKNSDSDHSAQLEELSSCDLEPKTVSLKKAGFLFNREAYEEALKKYRAILDEKALTEEEKAKVYYHMGSAEFYLDRYNDAIGHLHQAKSLGYDKSEVAFKLGRCHYHLDEYEKSKSYYIKVLKANNTNNSAWNNMALNYEELGEDQLALKMFYIADSIAEGRDPLYKANILDNLVDRDQWDEAHAFGVEAYARYPYHADITNHFANTLNNKGLHDSAVAICKKLIREKPAARSELYFRLGYSYNNLGKQDSALFYYYKDLENDGTHPVTLNNMAAIFRQNGLLDKAEKYIKLSLDLDDDELYKHLTLRKILLWQHEYQELYRQSLKIDEKFPDNKENASYIGYALMQIDKFGKAVPYWHKDIRIFPDDPRSYNNLGRCYAKTGRYEKAMAYFDTALAMNPDNSFIYHNRASMYAELGKYEQACEDLKTALDKEYNWVIDSGLIKVRNEQCPEISLNRKIIYHGYKGNEEHLSHKKFIEVLPNDSNFLDKYEADLLQDTAATRRKKRSESGYEAFKIYPNPTNGKFFIKRNGKQTGTTLKVYNLQSKLIHRSPLDEVGRISVDLTGQEPGTYIVFITDQSDVLHTGKIVVK